MEETKEVFRKKVLEGCVHTEEQVIESTIELAWQLNRIADFLTNLQRLK